MNDLDVNGRSYAPPSRPLVVICVDGNAPEYFDDGLDQGILPGLARFRERGFYALADYCTRIRDFVKAQELFEACRAADPAYLSVEVGNALGRLEPLLPDEARAESAR